MFLGFYTDKKKGLKSNKTVNCRFIPVSVRGDIERRVTGVIPWEIIVNSRSNKDQLIYIFDDDDEELLIEKDLSFIKVDINSHHMFCQQPLQWESCSNFEQQEMTMTHSIKVTVKDLYSNTWDDWIVSFRTCGYHVSHNRDDFFPNSVISLHAPHLVSWYW